MDKGVCPGQDGCGWEGWADRATSRTGATCRMGFRCEQQGCESEIRRG
jgi:hypothetical protein